MLRPALWALAPLAVALWPTPAAPCTCPSVNDIVHPPGTTIPARDGLIGRLVGTPTISVTYTDDPASTQIPGTFQVHSGPGGVSATWTFVPREPLTVGRTVRAIVRSAPGASAPMTSRELLVSSSTIAAPPAFAGITGLQAILTRIGSFSNTACNIGSEQSRVVLEGLPPPSTGAPLYRYFFYRQGSAPPAEPSLYGVPNRYLSSVSCGQHTLRCEPDVAMRFQPGETWCARVEATDLMGHRSGYDSEACATIAVEDVDVVEVGSMLSCVPSPSVPDAGIVADTGAPALDAGAAAADAGSARSDAAAGGSTTNDDGCTCVRPSAGESLAPAVSAVLVVAWVAGRRRRGSALTRRTGRSAPG